MKKIILLTLASIFAYGCASSTKTTERTAASVTEEDSNVDIACIVTNSDNKKVLFQYSREGESKTVTRQALSYNGCLTSSERSGEITSSSEEMVEGDLAVIVDFKIKSLNRIYKMYHKKDFGPTHQLEMYNLKGEPLATYTGDRIECHELAYSPPSRCEGH